MRQPDTRNVRRRTVLKSSLAVATTGLLGVGTTAASSETSVSAEEAGIRSEVNKLLAAGDTLAALKLLNANDVDYTATYNSRVTSEQDDAIAALTARKKRMNGSGGVSTQDFLSKDQSNVTVYAWNLANDTYRARIDFTVEAFNDALDPDMPGTNDLVSLGYSQPNEAMSDTLDYGMLNYDSSILSVRETPVVDGPGAVLDVNDGQTDTNQSTYRGYLAFDVDKDSSDNETLAGEYCHTWSAGNIGAAPGSVSYSWNGLGIAVDPGTFNDKWELTGSDRF